MTPNMAHHDAKSNQHRPNNQHYFLGSIKPRTTAEPYNIRAPHRLHFPYARVSRPHLG